MKSRLFLLLFLLASAPLARAQSAADAATPADLFKSKCAMCHGEDGSGSVLGHRLNIKDLRSAEVQQRSDADLEKFIAAGTDKMPAFKNRISDTQIQQLVEYIRHFAAKSN